MNGLIESTYLRAVELDDDFPDDVCPGCQQDITGWRDYAGHYMPGAVLNRQAWWYRARVAMPWPMTNGAVSDGDAPQCPWSRDYLTARAFRRSYIAGWLA